jgi:hypothetical protein
LRKKLEQRGFTESINALDCLDRTALDEKYILPIAGFQTETATEESMAFFTTQELRVVLY